MYLIFTLIDSFALSPISGTEYADYVFTIRKANRHDPFTDAPQTVVPLFARAVRQILGDDALRVGKSALRLREADPVLLSGSARPSSGPSRTSQ